MVDFLKNLKTAVLGTVNQYDALPEGDSINIDPAYILELHISGFKVQGSGFRVQGSGFRVRGSGFARGHAAP